MQSLERGTILSETMAEICSRLVSLNLFSLNLRLAISIQRLRVNRKKALSTIMTKIS